MEFWGRMEPETHPEPAAPEKAIAAEALEWEEEGPWWHLLVVYTRDWIHYGAIFFFVFLIFAAAVRGLFAR